jgi:hypothetical protein
MRLLSYPGHAFDLVAAASAAPLSPRLRAGGDVGQADGDSRSASTIPLALTASHPP